MTSRATVAVLRTQPETVLDDLGRLFQRYQRQGYLADSEIA
jgi:hypothetical protein